jgi:two-component system, OmpR family, phosphate regulon sensor histidine kinase PhoR
VFANAAFRDLGAVDDPEGRDYREVVSGSQLLGALGDALASKEDGRGRIVEGGRTWAFAHTGVQGQDQVVFSLADVTEMANLAATKRDFAVNVAHELRTPLTAIKGFAETLAESVQGDHAKYVATILRNTERLISLVRDVQTLALLESPGFEPGFQAVDLHPLAACVLDLFRPTAVGKGLELDFDPGDVPPVNGDAFRLEQVLVNLLDNAVKYTDSGSVRVSLSVRDGMAVIEVSDTGQGIPAEEIPRLCERFYVVDRSRSRSLGGTGLGLAIVKHIVMLHGGSLDIRSEIGRGSTFSVRLPLPEDHARS